MPDAKKLADLSWVVFFAVTCCLVMLAVAAWAIPWTWTTAILALRGQAAVATCTLVEFKPQGNGVQHTWSATYRVDYTADDGNRHSAEMCGLFVRLDVSDSIEILYDPRDSSRIQKNTWTAMWLVPSIFWGIVVLIVLAVWQGRNVRKRRGPAWNASVEAVENQ